VVEGDKAWSSHVYRFWQRLLAYFQTFGVNQVKLGDLVMIKWTMSHNFQKQVAGVVLRIDRNQVEVLLHNSEAVWFSSWELEGADESR